jgi:hypothetical protein
MLTFSRNKLLEQPAAMKKSLIFALAITLLVSGCSTASLIYRNAEGYLEYKINGYTSFNARQKETIRQDVSDYMRWHRKYALPEYIIFLQNLNGSAQYEGRLSAETAAQLRGQLMNLYRETMAPAIRPAALLLSSLDSAQILELGRTFAEDFKKQKQEEIGESLDDSLDKRAKKTLAFLDWLAGDLSSQQVQQIREMSRRLPFAAPIYIQNREANQSRLIALLSGHASADQIAAFLSSWIFTPEATRSPEQQRVIQSFETGSDQMIVQIQALLTPRQKNHIHERLSANIEEMRELATDKPAAGGVSR